VKQKLDLVMARLNRLCSEEDNEDNEDNEGAVWDESEHERRVGLFEWVAGIQTAIHRYPNCPLALSGQLEITETHSTIASMPRALKNVKMTF